jgi:hypothetical protein
MAAGVLVVVFVGALAGMMIDVARRMVRSTVDPDRIGPMRAGETRRRRVSQSRLRSSWPHRSIPEPSSMQPVVNPVG